MTDFEKLKQELATLYPYTPSNQLHIMAINLFEAFDIAAKVLIEQSDIETNLETLTAKSPDIKN